MLKMRRRTLLATLLTLLLVVACVIGAAPLTVSAVQSAATSLELTSSHAGKELSGEYYVPEGASLTLKGGTATSGLRVKSGSTLTIHIPANATLTVIGGAASTTSGGGAGIEVPSTSTLRITGDGTLNATGGAAASGGNGANGETARWGDDDYSYIPDSGYGGYGGGGAGAGIGTKGGNGGASTSWRTAFAYSRTTWTDYFLDSNYSGNAAYNGYNGKSADACGTVYIASTVSYTAKGGGEGAKGGTGGSAGSRDYESDDHDIRGLAGGSGGGGGGAGKAGAGIGTGGGGGGGGASGGGIGYAWSCYFLGAGGGGGGAGAKGGGGGAWSSDSAIPDHDCSKYTNGKEQSSYSGSSGGLDVGGNGGLGCKVKIRASKSTSSSWEWPYGASGGKGGSAGKACETKEVLKLLPITVVVGESASVHYAYGTQFLPETLAVDTKTGHTFEGYYGEDGLQYYDANGVRTEQAVSASTGVIEAKFAVNSYVYSVTPTEGSDTAKKENASVQYGEPITLPTPQRDGYLFRGWRITTVNGGGTLNSDAYYTSTPAVAMYRLRSGGNVNSLVYRDGGTVAQTAGFDKIGDSITLYNLATGDNDEVLFEEIWMENSFTVIFKDFDGQEISAVAGEYNTSITAPTLPSHPSDYYEYTFKCWKCNIDDQYYEELPLFGSFIGLDDELGEAAVREGVTFTAVYDITYKKQFELTGSLKDTDNLVMNDPQFPNGVLVLTNDDKNVPVVTNFTITKNDGVSTLLLIPQYDINAFTIKAISVNGVCLWGEGAVSSNVLNGFNVEITGKAQPSDALKILLDNLTVDSTVNKDDVFIQIVYEMREAIGGKYEFGFVTAQPPVNTDSITHGDRSEAYGFYDPALEDATNPFAFNELEIKVDTTAINVVIRATGVIEIAQNQTFVYNGEELSALELSELIGRALQYSYNGFAKKRDDTLTIKWYADENGEIEISAPKDAGTYYIGISAKETAYYSAVTEVKEKFTITSYKIYISTNDQSFVYSGGETSILTGAANGGITTADGTPIEQAESFLMQELRFDGVTLVPGSYVNVDDYDNAIKGLFSFIGNGSAKNYDIEYDYGTLSITKADNAWKVEVSAPGGEYKGSAFDVIFDALFGDEDALVEYFYGYELLLDDKGNPLTDAEGNPIRNEIWKTAAPVNAGSYTVRVTIEGNDNYTRLVGETTLVITKKEIDANGLTFEADEKTYNGHQQFWLIDPNEDGDYRDAQVRMGATNAEIQALLQYLQFFGVEHLSTQGYTNSGTYTILAMVQITDPNHTFVTVKDIIDEETGEVVGSIEEETNVWTYEVAVTIQKLQIIVDATDQEEQYTGNAPGVQSGAAHLERVTLPDGTVLDFITADFFGGNVAIYTAVSGAFEEGTTYYTAEIGENGRPKYVVAEITEFAKDVTYYTLSYEYREARESVTLYTEVLGAYPAGRYELYAALAADSNYELVYEDANGVFVITRRKVAVPALGTLIYNGAKQYPEVPAELAGVYEYVFDPEGDYKNVGTYLVTVRLLDKVNYEWDEVTRTPLESYQSEGDIMIHFANKAEGTYTNVMSEAVLRTAPYLNNLLWVGIWGDETDGWANYDVLEHSDEDLILVWEIERATVVVVLPDATQQYVYGTPSGDIVWDGGEIQWKPGSEPFVGDENTAFDLIQFGVSAQYPTVGTHNATISYYGFNSNYDVVCEGGAVTFIKKVLTQEDLNPNVSAEIKDYTGDVLVLSPAGDNDSIYDFTVRLQRPGTYGGDVFSVIAVDTMGQINANGKRGEPFEYYIDGESGKIYVYVTIALNDTANYALAPDVETTFAIEAYIAQAENGWEQSPSIDAANDDIIPSAKPIFGSDYTVTYFADAALTQEVAVTEIAYGQTYWAVFTVEEHGNYQSLTGCVPFSREYMTVNIPVLRVDTANGPQVLAGETYLLTYDGLAHLLLRTEYAGNEGVYYTVEITAGEWKNVGSYTVTYTLADGYSWASTTSRDVLVYTLKIGKAALTLDADDQTVVFGQAAPTLTVTPTGLVNGETLELLAPTLAEHMVLSYAAGNNRGTYPIAWAADAEAALEQLLPNYDVTLTDGVLTVTRREFSFDNVTTPDHNMDGVTGSVALPEVVVGGLSYVYNNTDRVFRVDAESVPVEMNTVVTYWQNGGQFAGVPRNAGTYTVKIALVLRDGLNPDNYVIPAPVEVTVTIRKAQITITVGGQSFVYDKTDASAKLNTAPSGATVTYHNVPGDLADGSAITAITLVGSGYVDAARYPAVIGCTHTFSDANYEVIDIVNGTLTVTQATNAWYPELWASDAIVYNGSAVVLGTHYGAGAAFGNVSFTFYLKSNGSHVALSYLPVNAGTYYVSANVAETVNYTGLDSGFVELVIAKATLTLQGEGVSFNDGSFIYDGEVHRLTAVFSNALKVVYSDNNALTNVGRVQVTANFMLADDYVANYVLEGEVAMTAYLSVTPVCVTVVPANKTSVYGEALVPLTYTLDFIEYNPNYKDRYLAQLEGKITLSTAATSTSDVNDDGYAIAGVIDDGMTNYVVVFEDGTYRITKAGNSITLSAEDIHYLMTLDITYSALHGNVTLTYARADSNEFDVTPPTKVGSYVVKATVIGNNNYSDAVATAEFEIERAKLSAVQVTVFKDTATWEQVTTTTDGFSIDCGVTYWGDTSAYVQNSFTATSAGTFVLTAKPVDTVNYEDSDTVVLMVYAVSFDDDPTNHDRQENKADLSAPAYDVQYRFEGEKATLPQSTPTVEGYDFDVWTYNGTPYDFNAGVSDHMILYAAWTIQVYEVYFYDESVTGAGVVNGVFQEGTVTRGELLHPMTLVEYGDPLIFPTLIPTKAENEAYTYTFRHYAMSLRGETAVAEGSAVLGDMTLYAVYAAEGKSFDVIYKVAIEGFDYTEQRTVTAKYGEPLIGALDAVKWFADDLWYTDEARTQKALGFVPHGGATVYGAYVFDVGAGDVNGDGVVTTNDITLYRQWIVGGYDIISIPAGGEWAIVDDPAFDAGAIYFLERVFDANGDDSGDIRDITTARMAIVGGYGYTIAQGAAVGVSGQGIASVNSVIKNASTPSELTLSLAQGGHIRLGDDVVVPLGDVITVSRDTVIYLNGYDLDFSACTTRPIEMASDASLTIYGTDETVKIGKYGLVKIPMGATNVSVTLNGGSYVANMDKGSFIKPLGEGAITITLNDVVLDDESNDSYLIDASRYGGEDLDIRVDGGTYTVSHGIVLGGRNTMNLQNATFNVSFMGVEASGSYSALPEDGVVATVDHCTITLSSPAYNEMNACVIVGWGGQMTVTNSTLISNTHVASVLSKPSSKITLEGCTITASNPSYDAFYFHEGVGTIERNNCNIDQ